MGGSHEMAGGEKGTSNNNPQNLPPGSWVTNPKTGKPEQVPHPDTTKEKTSGCATTPTETPEGKQCISKTHRELAIEADKNALAIGVTTGKNGYLDFKPDPKVPKMSRESQVKHHKTVKEEYEATGQYVIKNKDGEGGLGVIIDGIVNGPVPWQALVRYDVEGAPAKDIPLKEANLIHPGQNAWINNEGIIMITDIPRAQWEARDVANKSISGFLEKYSDPESINLENFEAAGISLSMVEELIEASIALGNCHNFDLPAYRERISIVEKAQADIDAINLAIGSFGPVTLANLPAAKKLQTDYNALITHLTSIKVLSDQITTVAPIEALDEGIAAAEEAIKTHKDAETAQNDFATKHGPVADKISDYLAMVGGNPADMVELETDLSGLIEALELSNTQPLNAADTSRLFDVAPLRDSLKTVIEVIAADKLIEKAKEAAKTLPATTAGITFENLEDVKAALAVIKESNNNQYNKNHREVVILLSATPLEEKIAALETANTLYEVAQKVVFPETTDINFTNLTAVQAQIKAVVDSNEDPENKAAAREVPMDQTVLDVVAALEAALPSRTVAETSLAELKANPITTVDEDNWAQVSQIISNLDAARAFTVNQDLNVPQALRDSFEAYQASTGAAPLPAPTQEITTPQPQQTPLPTPHQPTPQYVPPGSVPPVADSVPGKYAVNGLTIESFNTAQPRAQVSAIEALGSQGATFDQAKEFLMGGIATNNPHVISAVISVLPALNTTFDQAKEFLDMGTEWLPQIVALNTLPLLGATFDQARPFIDAAIGNEDYDIQRTGYRVARQLATDEQLNANPHWIPTPNSSVINDPESSDSIGINPESWLSMVVNPTEAVEGNYEKIALSPSTAKTPAERLAEIMADTMGMVVSPKDKFFLRMKVALFGPEKVLRSEAPKYWARGKAELEKAFSRPAQNAQLIAMMDHTIANSTDIDFGAKLNRDRTFENSDYETQWNGIKKFFYRREQELPGFTAWIQPQLAAYRGELQAELDKPALAPAPAAVAPKNNDALKREAEALLTGNIDTPQQAGKVVRYLISQTTEHSGQFLNSDAEVKTFLTNKGIMTPGQQKLLNANALVSLYRELNITGDNKKPYTTALSILLPELDKL